jgi:hypothetical protein
MTVQTPYDDCLQNNMTFPIPAHHRALLLERIDAGFCVVSLPTPHADPGSAIVRVEVASSNPTIETYITAFVNVHSRPQ